MMKAFTRHGPREIFFDLLFVVWVSYAAVTGHFIPPQIASLLNNQPPAVAIHDPAAPIPGVAPSDHPVGPDLRFTYTVERSA